MLDKDIEKINFSTENENKILKKIMNKLKYDEIASKIKIIVIMLIVVIEIIYIFKIFDLTSSKDKATSKNNIAIINYESQVTHQSVEEVIKKFEKVRASKDKYKKVIFTINSPGGSPEASEELAEYIKWFSKDIIPVMGYVKGYALSGGYYIASSFDKVRANKNALIGSIGVIMPHFNLKPLADKLGVESDNVAYGEHKELIPMIGKVSEDQKKYLKDNLLSKMYMNFVTSVATNRNLKTEDILKVAEGNVFIATDERIKGVLVDEITSLIAIENELRKEYKDVKFIEISKDKNKGFRNLLSESLNLNLNIDSSILKDSILK